MRRALALLATAAVALLLLVPGGPAAAHTELSSVIPADGASVDAPPTEVVLTFSEPLADPEAAQVEVVDPVGDDLVAAPPAVEGAVVTVPLNQAVAEGLHEVRYVVIAEDGHRLEGVTTFTFAPPAAVATPTATLPPDPDPAEVITPAADATAADASTDPAAGATTPAASPPEPTPDATATAAPTDEAATGSDGGVPPVVGVVVVVLLVAAVGAVLLRRSRGDAGLG